MRKLGHALAIAAIAATGGVGLAACGSDDGGSGDDSGTTGKTGGSIRVGSALPDSYDPVLFQTVQANQGCISTTPGS